MKRKGRSAIVSATAPRHDQKPCREFAAPPAALVAEMLVKAFADVRLEGAAARTHVFFEGLSLLAPFVLAAMPVFFLVLPFLAGGADGVFGFRRGRRWFVHREFIAHADIQLAHDNPPIGRPMDDYLMTY